MCVSLIRPLGVSLVLWPCLVFGQSVAPGRITEAQALDLMAAHDQRLRAARAGIEELRAAQAGRALRTNPTLTFSRESVGDSHDDFLLGRQELDASGRLGRLRAAGLLAVEAAEATAQHQVVQLQAKVRDAFAVLVLAQDRESVIARSLKELENLLDILRTREQEGEGSRYDRMRGERALAEIDADLAAASAARAEAQGRLAALVGAPDETALVADGRTEPVPPAAGMATQVERALTTRADLKALTLEAARFQTERLAAGRLAIPTPTLSGGLKRSRVDQQERSGYVFSLDLSVPLYDRGRPAAALAIAQMNAAQARAAMLRQLIETEIRVAHAVAEIHRRNAERYRASTSNTGDDLLAVARLGYEEGGLGILELLDAVRQALDGRVRALEMTAAARRAVIELDRIVGLEINP